MLSVKIIKNETSKKKSEHLKSGTIPFKAERLGHPGYDRFDEKVVTSRYSVKVFALQECLQ